MIPATLLVLLSSCEYQSSLKRLSKAKYSIMIKVVIVEDEPKSRQALEFLLSEFFSNIEIVGTGDSVTSAIEAIKKCQPDLVFLDIEIQEGTGFQVIEAFQDVFFEVIFTTAYESYALK